MICRRTLIAVALAAAGLTAGLTGCGDVGRSEIRVGRTWENGRRAVVVENSRMRVSVLPDLGGRVSGYVLKASGRNQLWVNPEAPPPAEVADYHGYGGIEDHLNLEGRAVWPTRLPLQVYAYDVTPTAENVTLTLRWQCPTWKIERSHTVYRNSTRLHTRVVVTNLDNAPRELTARSHPALAVGGDADNGDCILQPVDGAALVHRYAPPWDRDVAVPAGAWAAAIDSSKNEAVLFAFPPGDVDEVNLWFDRSCYNVEPTSAPRPLAPGQSAEISFDLFILSGKDLAASARALPLERKSAEQIATSLATLSAHKARVAAIEENDFYLARWGAFRLELPASLICGTERTAGGEPSPVWLRAQRVAVFDNAAQPFVFDFRAVRASDAKPVQMDYVSSVEFGPEVLDDQRPADRDPAPPEIVKRGFGLRLGDLPDDTYAFTLHVGDNATASAVRYDTVVARQFREKIEKSKPGDKDAFKPAYAAARWYVEAAQRAARDAAGGAPPGPSVAGRIGKLLAQSREALDGKAAAPRSGSFPRFYFSRIDDSVQGCLVTLPDNYTASRNYPCLVFLHGRDPSGRPFDPDRRMPAIEALAARFGVVVIEPHGRGNLGYRGPAADDVMSALERVRAEFPLDGDRIYLMGASMGGGGAWWLGQRFPGVFAGIAPIYGPADYRVGLPDAELDRLTPWRQWWLDANSAVSFAEDLLNTAVYLYHGAKDRSVSVENSRRMVDRFTELGHRDWVYEEDPRGVHATPSRLPGEMLDFLLDFKLERAPKSLSVVSPHLRFCRSGWARMDAFERPCEFGELHARVVGQSVAVATRNLAGFTLQPLKDLLDVTKPFVVNVDGDSAFLIGSSSGAAGGLPFRLESDAKTERPRWVRGAVARSARGALVKDADVEGPMTDVFRTRFILVPGTLGDNRTDAVCRAEAERWRDEEWRRVQHVGCIIRSDNELTAQDRRDAHLVLIGGPDLNAVTKELAPALPVAFAPDGAIALDGKTVSGPYSGVAFLYPNPNQPARYVLVVAATRPQGIPGILTRARMEFDYYAFDAETKESDSWRDAESALLFGFFDQKWKFDRRVQWGRAVTPPEKRLK